MIFKDTTLSPLWSKIRDGGRLSFDDGRALFSSPDLLGVGWMADRVRRRRHGDLTASWSSRITPSSI
jgi:aminodeoxyfutalosine synthase